MKSKQQKRIEAHDRLLKSEYHNAKSVRNGTAISEEDWKKKKQQQLDNLDKLIGGTNG